VTTHHLNPELWPLFAPLLAEAVSTSTEAHPTVRVWKNTELIGVINRIAREHRAELKTTFPSGTAMLKKLKNMRWLRDVPLAENVTGRNLYLMDMEAAEDAVVDPLEVLQAALPAGVISYFAALSFYELTSQMPAFYHIGRLANGHPPESSAPADTTDRNPLGSALFEYDGVMCYQTKRYRGLTPGVQSRIIGPRTTYRITTLEQTLLDAILQPLRCGGEAVVLEAWGQAFKRADFDRMAEYLQAIGRDSLMRRVGTMLEIHDVALKVGSPLGNLLNNTKKRLRSTDSVIPLLSGLDFAHASTNWKVSHP
jgi:hypothetical protein